jgi:hypothetical protein
MSDAVKPLMKSTTSSSGTHPKTTGHTKPVVPPDDEFRAFFAQGDAGDYEGGSCQSPTSMGPVTFDQVHYDTERDVDGRDTYLRRAFFGKVVGGVVAGCLALLFVAVGVKSIRGQRVEGRAPQSVAARQVDATSQPQASLPRTPANVPEVLAATPQPGQRSRVEEQTLVGVQNHDSREENAAPPVGDPARSSDVIANSKVSQKDSVTTVSPPAPAPAKEQVSNVRQPRKASGAKAGPKGLANRTSRRNKMAAAVVRPSVAAFPVD